MVPIYLIKTRFRLLRHTLDMTKKLFILPFLLFAACAAHSESNCPAIQARIDAKIKASGVAGYTLQTVDAGAQVAGKVVGTCDLGTKKIVYTQGQSREQPMLTECKDGTVTMGGDCKS